MDAQQIQEMLRKIIEREPVWVVATDGREIPVSGLNFDGGQFTGYSQKFTGEFIPAAEVEALVF